MLPTTDILNIKHRYMESKWVENYIPHDPQAYQAWSGYSNVIYSRVFKAKRITVNKEIFQNDKKDESWGWHKKYNKYILNNGNSKYVNFHKMWRSHRQTYIITIRFC